MKALDVWTQILVVGLSTVIAETFAQTNFWESTNGPFGGEIRAVAFKSPGTIFAGTSTAGVFRSSDNGNTWVQASLGLPLEPDDIIYERVYALAINSRGDIYAGTRVGLYVSTDDGESWSARPLTENVNIIIMNSSDHVFAATGSGIYRSIDNGATWIQTGLVGHSVYALAINSQEHLFAGTYQGVYVSVDNGDTWTQSGLIDQGIRSLTINSLDCIFAGIITGIYRSANSGSTWVLLDVGLDTLYDVRYLVSPPNDHIFAGVYDYSDQGSGVYRSADDGDTWQCTNHGLTDSANLRYLATNCNGDIFAGTEHGLFRSIDDGDNWALSGVPNSYVCALNFVGEHLFAETFWEFDKGILFRSTDYGDQWDFCNNGLENTLVLPIIENAQGNLLAGSLTGVFQSADGGRSWMAVGHPENVVYALSMDSSGQIFAGTDAGVFYSIDHGNNWLYRGLANSMVRSLVISADQYIFAGTETDGMFRSSDSGLSWEHIQAGLTTYSIYSLVIAPNGYVFAATDSGVFRSIDQGHHWLPVNSGFTHLNINDLAVNASGVVFASTFSDNGVFQTSNNGEEWSQINDGLTNPFVWTLTTSPDGFLFAGTHGNGVFRSTESTLHVRETTQGGATSFKLSQNYPNPFNSTTTISYQLSVDSHLDLHIYNLLGQKVRKLVSGGQTAGHNTIAWDGKDDLGRDVSSGMYFCVLQIENGRQVRKMLLLR